MKEFEIKIPYCCPACNDNFKESVDVRTEFNPSVDSVLCQSCEDKAISWPLVQKGA
jgi:hypothetical protein